MSTQFQTEREFLTNLDRLLGVMNITFCDIGRIVQERMEVMDIPLYNGPSEVPADDPASVMPHVILPEPIIRIPGETIGTIGTMTDNMAVIVSQTTENRASYPRPEPSQVERKLPFSAVLTQDFIDSVLWIEEMLGLNAYNLLCCMAFETGMTFSPKIKNPGSSATGLIQFMDTTARRLGTTTLALAQMSAVRQLSYVYKYFKDYADRGHDLSAWNLGDTYMAILWPAGIGKADDFAVFVEGKGKAYAVNKGLDKNKDGMVTRGECLIKIREVEKIGLTKLGGKYDGK